MINGERLNTHIVNLYGGPGTGKSTTAAGVFSLLKLHGINCEYVPEFAKDLTWEKREHTLTNQRYVWGKQHHRLFRLDGQVDVIITDSPLFLSVVYSKVYNFDNPSFIDAVIESHFEFSNLNFMLERVKEYNPNGRHQSEDEAKGLDNIIMNALDEYGIHYSTIVADFNGINTITSIILNSVFLKEQSIFFGKKAW